MGFYSGFNSIMGTSCRFWLRSAQDGLLNLGSVLGVIRRLMSCLGCWRFCSLCFWIYGFLLFILDFHFWNSRFSRLKARRTE